MDGVDIDWEDNTAMNNGVGMSWIVTFQKTLRTALPSHIITHAPQAPYFNQQIYNFKSYIEVHQQVGSGINFYNIQFYNQGNNAYNTYTTLF